MTLDRRQRLAAALAAVLVVAACAKPPSSQPRSMDSPTDLAALRWCEMPDDDGGVFVEPVVDDACSSDTVTPRAHVLVANAGNEMLHAISIDFRIPEFVDFDPSIPGVTGIIVPEGPNQVEALAHPAFALVASRGEVALSVVDVPGARVVEDLTFTAPSGDALTRSAIPLPEPVGLLTVLQDDTGDTVAVWSQPLGERLVAARVSATCDGDPAVYRVGCEPAAEIEVLQELALPGAPTRFAVADDGRVFTIVRGHPRVVVGALFGAALERCGGSPCVLDELAAATSCADTLDNDGDGLADADDPQCFGPGDDEAGTLLTNGTPTACTNGLDDDGDGSGDADDPDCRDAGDRVEGSGYDGADEFVSATSPGGTFPSLEGADPPTLDAAAPACRNETDDDGDGLADADDPDCYGPNDDGEAQQEGPVLGGIALMPEQDILLVTDRRRPQVFYYDADSGELLDVNELDPRHTTPGTRLGSLMPDVILPEYARVVTDETEDGRETRFVEWRTRTAHIAGALGFAETVVIDDTVTAFDGDPDEGGQPIEGPHVVARFEPLDTSDRRAEFDRVDCSIPNVLGPDQTRAVRCTDPEFPQPAVLDPVTADPDDCSSTTDDGTGDGGSTREEDGYDSQDGDLFGLLPQTEAWEFAPFDADCDDADSPVLRATTAPDDYALRGGDWSVTFEGVIGETTRDDVFVSASEADGRAWLEVPGGDPCDATVSVCDAGIYDPDECPELADLCQADPDRICQEFDVCALCPGACSSVDFCAAGVLPGDIVVLKRFPISTADDAPEECLVFSPDHGDVAGEEQRELEYVICEVAAEHVEIALRGTGCSDEETDDADLPEMVDVLPVDCPIEPIEMSIRAGSNPWVVARDSAGGPSPYRELDGRCVVRTDAERRLSRLELGEPFESFYGFTIQLGRPEGVETHTRDFSVTYELDRNFTTRTSGAGEFLLGPGTVAGISVETRRGRRIVFADESQSVVWIYSATTGRAGGVLP